MFVIEALKLYILIFAVACNLLLAFIVYRSNSKSATNRIFMLLALVTSIWLGVNYSGSLSSQFVNSLAISRLSIFLAVPQIVLFYFLARTLPLPDLPIKRKYFQTILGVCFLVMLVTMSPFAFTAIEIQGGSSVPVPGWGMAIFALFAIYFSLTAVYTLIRRFMRSTGLEKEQLKFIMLGMLLMLGLIILTILFPVLLFKNISLVPLSPLYTLIFLGMTAYAIVKHHLFNLKVITTEALTVILWILLFSKAVSADSPEETFINVIITAASVLLGVFLIKSVRKEVQQRERLEFLDAQLEKANVQLQALDKARSEFITMASHQLRTPPSSIRWYLAALKSGDFGALNSEQQEAVTKMWLTNNSMISLIDDMLNVSRVERGKMEFVFQPINIYELVKSTFDQLEPLAQMKKLELVLKQPKIKFPQIMADKEKLRQVINNLIDNAIKYTKVGKVTVELEKVKENIVLKVTDTGKGVSSADIKTIFEKFGRGKDSTNYSTGLGLGLYLAKIIIEQHDGKFRVESQGEGKGSTFKVILPIKTDIKSSFTYDLVQA